MTTADLDCDAQVVERKTYRTSNDYMTHDFDEDRPVDVLDIICAYPTVAVSKSNPIDEIQPFVLRHPDIGFQNILTDPEGSVTDIIDWEGCLSAPRCAGYASILDSLRRPPSSERRLRFSKIPHMDWQMHGYTQIYADAMRGAVNVGGCVDLIHKLFKRMPLFVGVEMQGFAKLIGKGCAPAEETLKIETGKLLEPDDFSM
ncbi:hypothetical protein E8E11_007098 [Didymella keratinophila]|nr:hypothetical protein E8E11_007098 [Didymella keratinophila]